ncbi:MAG: tetratricopeptide repeat protein [Bernardetiaceae bacterium]
MNAIQTAKTHFNKGLQAAQDENYTAAIAHFTAAIETLEGQAVFFYNRAQAHYKLQQFDQAIPDYDQAIALDPKNAEFFAARGIAQHQLRQHQEALQDMDAALRLEPQNPYRYSSRAFIKARVGMVMSAMEDYKKAIELDPEDAIAYNNLGMLQEQLGYKGFEKNYEKADHLTGGRSAEKPDLKKIVADYEAQKKTNTDRPPVPETGLTPKKYLDTLRQVLTSRQTQAEFWRFLKGTTK